MYCWRNPARFQHRAGRFIYQPLAISRAHRRGRAALFPSTFGREGPVYLPRFSPSSSFPRRARSGRARRGRGRGGAPLTSPGRREPLLQPLGLLASGPRRRPGLCRCSRPLHRARAGGTPLPPPGSPARPRRAASGSPLPPCPPLTQSVPHQLQHGGSAALSSAGLQGPPAGECRPRRRAAPSAGPAV